MLQLLESIALACEESGDLWLRGYKQGLIVALVVFVILGIVWVV